MHSQTSYERIEYILGELRAQARADGQQGQAAGFEAKQHVQALLVLFEENLEQMAQPTGPAAKQ